nr:MAG TPA: hypothetical protein [Caudoviricetes sp.]
MACNAEENKYSRQHQIKNMIPKIKRGRSP